MLADLARLEILIVAVILGLYIFNPFRIGDLDKEDIRLAITLFLIFNGVVILSAIFMF